jgi:FMN hydrolase / 5-amino-6-(5-phospho-D-ribitylamino)uracil phosphatase
MKKPKIIIISIDVFQTLVMLEEGRDFIWKQFLKSKYTDELAEMYWNRATDILFKKISETAFNNDSFKNTRTKMEESYSILFDEIGLDYSAHVAADALIDMHKRNKLYDDVGISLETLGKKYPICISSDCDNEMISDISKIYPFNRIFTSEDLKAYKQNPRFFKKVIEHYGVNPDNILHIEDSNSDVSTPKKLGIITCWINRENKKWSHEITPDFEVKSLSGVIEILEKI